MEGNQKREKKFNQYLASIVANIIGISWGNSIGWSSPAIAKMTDDLSDSPLDFVPSSDQLSWIGSILTVGGLCGAIIFAPLPGTLGRKLSLLVTSLCFIASFLLLIFTHDVISIYIARFLQGIGSGAVMVLLPMYVGEISSAHCRGILSSFIQMGLVGNLTFILKFFFNERRASTVGILYAYCIGPYVSYVMFNWLCLLIPLIFIATFMFMPETPHFYLSKGEREAASKSLQFLRGASVDEVEAELTEIENSVLETMQHKTNLVDLFKERANLSALAIVVGLICFQNFSGIDAVLFYSETIFSKAGSSLDPAVATIFIGLTMFIASGLSSLFVDRSGRKVLLLISGGGMAAVLAAMGLYFFLDERGLTDNIGLLPVTSLIGFISFFCFGFGPLPFTLLGELLSPEIKSMASSIAIAACWLVDFSVTKAFLPLENVFGNYGNFWIFAGFCVLATVFTSLVVFETKGLTLNEIQDRLKNRK